MAVRGATEVLPAGWTRGEIAVVGLARSGRAVAELLRRAGAAVYASDAAAGEDVARAADLLHPLGVSVTVGGHDLARLARSALVVASPGIPPESAPLTAARGAGVPVVSEIEVALRFLPGVRYIAVTGTNGKTTTTSLVHRLLGALTADAVAAGNIGTPLAEVALQPNAPAWVALEISSFQLHDTPSIAPTVGVLTNLSPNHLDRYRTLQEYYADKALLLRNATPRSIWVTNADDPAVQELVRGAAGHHLRFTTGRGAADAYWDRGRDTLVVRGEPLLPRRELALVGEHNVANALAAALAVLGADPAHQSDGARRRVADALRQVRALAHRIEPVGRFADVEWVNDSKSTNVASTRVALRGMTRPTILLLGGRHKGEAYTALADELRRVGKCVIAYGESAELIERDLGTVLEVERVHGDFASVLRRARDRADPGDVVLLSPACSSYDMFANYEERGRAFRRLAAELGSAPV